MSENAPPGDVDVLLREAGKYYSRAAEICREAEMNSTEGATALEQAKNLTERANELTQRAFGMMKKEKSNNS